MDKSGFILPLLLKLSPDTNPFLLVLVKDVLLEGNEASNTVRDDIDIDLADPEVQMATTQIQAGFRGHQARKEVEKLKENGSKQIDKSSEKDDSSSAEELSEEDESDDSSSSDEEQDEETVEILEELEEKEFVSEELSYQIKLRIEYEKNL